MYTLGIPKEKENMIEEENYMVVAFCGHSTYIPNAADEEEVLAALEQLVGDRKGQHSIRINDQWRVCFTEKDGHFYDVEIVDYH